MGTLHSSDPHPESGGAKFVLEKSILGGAGWWSKTGWDFFYLGGAQICGWGFSIFGHKNIFAGTIFFSLTSFQILKKKHPILNFPFTFPSFFSFSILLGYFSIFISIFYFVLSYQQGTVSSLGLDRCSLAIVKPLLRADFESKD